MKFLHTSNLHLGKRRRGEKLRGQQRAGLAQMVNIACREQVDAVLLCGNICENATGLALLRDFASKLSAEGIAVYAVDGACDKLPLSVEGVCACDVGALQSVPLQDEHGALVLHMLPYMPVADVLSVLGAAPLMLGVRNVLMMHCQSAGDIPLTAFDYVALGCGGVTVVELGALDDVQVREVPLQKID